MSEQGRDYFLGLLIGVLLLGMAFVAALIIGRQVSAEPMFPRVEKTCKQMIADRQRYLPEKCFYEMRGDV